jgi:hypothetical protein
MAELRILVVTIEYLELESGNGILARSIARCLVQHGHHVSIDEEEEL